MSVKEPLLGQLNQGSIFSCAKAERYPNCKAHGVVVTARCDLEQDKYNVLNYVPVVPLVEWLKVDGYEIILSRASADFSSKLDTALKAIALPPSILTSQTPNSILEHYIRGPNADTATRKAESRFVDLDKREQELGRWRQGYSKSNLDLFERCEPLVRSMLKELINHKLNGYYFFSKVEAGSEDSGFVALLREVNHLPRVLARLIAEGMEATSNALSIHPEWLTYVDFEASDFAMPVGEITSPEVEHLLQTFSHLFGRIGLPDPDGTMVETLCKIRPQ